MPLLPKKDSCIWCGGRLRRVTASALGAFFECSTCPARFPDPMPQAHTWVHGRQAFDDDDSVNEYKTENAEPAIEQFELDMDTGKGLEIMVFGTFRAFPDNRPTEEVPDAEND